MAVDLSFLLAVGAIGWGLALVGYRPLARAAGWPLGFAQSAVPTLTFLVGVLCAGVGSFYGLSLGLQHGGLVILIFGLGLAVFWNGFLRVGAQSALLLAPLAAGALMLASLLSNLGYN